MCRPRTTPRRGPKFGRARGKGEGGGCTSIGKGDEEMHARMLEVHAHALELNEYSTYAVTNFILDLWDF
jgi:hypothetical protein